jgi:hypothetical protein
VEESVGGLPPKTICEELTRLYFDIIHDQFHSLFHKPSMIQDVLDNRAPVVLLYGMMALSARSGIDLAWRPYEHADPIQVFKQPLLSGLRRP